MSSHTAPAVGGVRTGARLAERFVPLGPWVLLVVYAACAIGALTLHIQRLGPALEDFADLSVFLMYVVVGGFIAARRPGNPVGWLLSVVGVGAVFSRLAAEYTATAASGAHLPIVAFVAWLDVWVWSVSLGSGLILLPLLFPTGRLPSPGWRLVGGAAIAVFAIPIALSALAPGPFASLPSLSNPLGLEPLRPLTQAAGSGLVAAVALAAIVCAAAPIARFRHAPIEERQQLKWFAFAAGLLVVALFVNVAIGDWTYVLLAVSLALVPIAVGIAILRYRLYGIDVIINRTLVWVPLTGILGGLYAGLVALLQRVFVNLTGDRSDAAVIITTLVLAGSFTPIRRVLDTVVDRRFRSAPGPGPAHALTLGPATLLDDAEVVRRIETIAERVALEVNRRSK
ncbi:MAG TPA: hypothetical protein VIV06_07090 [Candidatus Limnocylindrales bacterium]